MLDARSSELAQISDVLPDELAARAHLLAGLHAAVDPVRVAAPLTDDLPLFRELIRSAVQYFRGAIGKEMVVSYAAEWLLDNDYLILQAIRLIAEDMPLSFDRQLPRLAHGWPRITVVAREVVLSSRARLDLDDLRLFIRAYQQVTPLTMGELWALPTMLRLTLVQAQAEAAAELTANSERLAALNAPRLEWPPEVTPADVIANGFISLRALAAEDWKDFFEELSLVEKLLCQDPAGAYAQMDFASRDMYRKAVEWLSEATGQAEIAVAEAAVQLAQAPAALLDGLSATVQRHVGYYLIDNGKARLEAHLGYRPTGAARLRRWSLAHPTLVYLGSIALLTGVLMLLALGYAAWAGAGVGQLLLALLVTAIPLSSLAIHLLHWVVTRSLPPRVLPKMDFRSGVPREHAALVVIPALLTSSEEAESLLGQLELHYLRNPETWLYFALASDFSDAAAAEAAEDAGLLRDVRAGVARLNARYPRPEGGSRFFLFHRPRQWNLAEGVWMGWERKRGKLHQLNRLLLANNHNPQAVQAEANAFSVIEGELQALPVLRYVITLDADTILPSDAAQRLVAAHAHPLNQPQLAPDGRVIAGYSILQPRTEISPVTPVMSHFTRIFSGDTGLDLYTLAVSDAYQDLFGEGIYVGKGIYALEAFEASLEGRIPENTLLSHDLFEGVHGRVALVTDIVLIENYPSRYLLHLSRMHRWIRGDWQLLPWLIPWLAPRVTSVDGRKLPPRLSLIDRWKIFDNLRRSLLAPALVLLLALAWLGLLPGAALVWTLLAVSSLAGPLYTTVFSGMIHFRRTARRRKDGAALPAGLLAATRSTLVRWLLALVFLLYEAYLSLNAIVVTLMRIAITRRSLLNWTTAAQAERPVSGITHAGLVWRQMLPAPLLAAGLLLGIWLYNPAALWVALPLLAAWMLSPQVALWISRPILHKPALLDEDDQRQLSLLARRTWLFFEQFIGPEDSWLPPDHFQEFPLGVVAHRTSPTNIGLNLLVSLGAYDLGYTGLLALSARLQNSFATLQRLERYRGHFLNWYDTRSLETLPPSYVSTVDSGNLAACFLALSQGLQALQSAPVLRRPTFTGLCDSLALLLNQLQKIEAIAQWQGSRELIAALETLQAQISALAERPQEWAPFLLSFDAAQDIPGAASGSAWAGWQQVEARLVALVEENVAILEAEDLRRLRVYAQQARRRMENAQREILVLQPWLAALAAPPAALAADDAPPALRSAWQSLSARAQTPPGLDRTSSYVAALRLELHALRAALPGVPAPAAQAIGAWCEQLEAQLAQGEAAVQTLLDGLRAIIDQSEAFFSEMDFAFLFDSQRQLFHIGYNYAIGRLDDNYYDLLASEARIASLIAIAKGDVPRSHWLHLSRPITQVDGQRVLLSWSATMFEYLMPTLLLRSFPNTLLDHSAGVAVAVQIAYAREKKVPWGISESGFYHFDANQAYQYRAFGVPSLGYKRGMTDDLVIAPYASLLALPYQPKAVVDNLAALEKVGAGGIYGLYEALDFSSQRLPYGSEVQVVREYMAHHQGMIFMALVNYFCKDLFIERFHADARIHSVDLLLQEQFPMDAPLEQAHLQETQPAIPEQPQVVMTPWRVRVNAPQPRVHYLTNGRFSSLLTAAGGGYATWQGLDLTRWRSDYTLGDWGQWVYIDDIDAEKLWSIGYLPTLERPQHQEVYFHPHQGSYTCRHGDISAAMNVTVAADDDVEVRQIELTNHSDRPRRVRMVSYGEVILATQAADRRHPAFNKLFIRSEWAEEQNTLLFHRRARSEGERTVYLAHTLVMRVKAEQPVRYESDRRAFIGRGGSIHAPQVFSQPDGLGGSTGATLDPIFALGQEFIIPPHSAIQAAYLTLVAPTREAALALAERFSVWSHIERTFYQARSEAEMELRQLGINTLQLVRIQHLLSGLLFPHARLRAPVEVLQANRLGQPGLWAFGISGDNPIFLVRLNSPDELELAQDALQAHTYWRRRNLKIDLVFLNQQGVNYGQELSGQLHRLLARSGSENWLNQRGGIFMLFVDRLSADEQALLETSARVLLDGAVGGLQKHTLGGERMPSRLPAFITSQPETTEVGPTPPLLRPQDWLQDNGLGGFRADGREYQIFLAAGQLAPAPWSNVIANPEFGFMTSESGLGVTWAQNSGENRLTPWHNDPLSEPAGEAVYLRDEETGAVWTPTPLPAGAPAPVLVRHGAGYTIYEHQSHDLHQALCVFAAADAPVKVLRINLKNLRPAGRRITVTYYAEWVLGVSREESSAYIIPEFDSETQALLARNPYNIEFGERVAFAAAGKRLHGLTANRTEFLGRLGDRARPAGLQRIGLAGEVQAGKDACAALQLHIDLEPQAEQQVYFLLGQGADRAAALALVRRFQEPEAVEQAWQAALAAWESLLGTVQVRTPDPALDLLLNRWLLYQTLSCRVWGRSGFYQSSGAYGFRDQLQDVMALTLAAPQVVREQLVRAAGHQFQQGDVLHWWHPPSGRGVRTRFSDDLLWLPFVASHYLRSTHDDSLLDAFAPFLSGPLLEPGVDEHYGHFTPSTEGYSLFEHCRRALEKGATRGAHGLPLMGSGDWNDGMNRVGHGGRGESVWLAWFLIDTLNGFADVCRRRGEEAQANDYRRRAEAYAQAIEAHAWDGQWYRRAYYDDGSPLGSGQNSECQIDAIAQSWGVLSGAGDAARVREAMEALWQRLVRREDGLLLLFTPPFDRTPRDPGYIKGYPPGVRENGGQYTHAAIWTVWAFAQLGQGERAYELLRLLNPIYKADTLEKLQRYRVEPYVVAADIYSVEPHTGLGGWTWYTGSSGWMYRLGMEAILGLRREGPVLCIDPCIPAHWPGYEITYRHHTTRLHIQVQNPQHVSRGVTQVTIDGELCADQLIPLLDDGEEHRVQVVLGAPSLQ